MHLQELGLPKFSSRERIVNRKMYFQVGKREYYGSLRDLIEDRAGGGVMVSNKKSSASKSKIKFYTFTQLTIQIRGCCTLRSAKRLQEVCVIHFNSNNNIISLNTDGCPNKEMWRIRGFSCPCEFHWKRQLGKEVES